ncbi:SDR family oxidoreductase [Streptomyces sp. NPDC004838]
MLGHGGFPARWLGSPRSSGSWAGRGLPVGRPNCVAPGPIATGRLRMRAREIGERDPQRAEALMAGVGTEADVARAIRYLASPESRFMSGQVLHLYR